MRALRLTALAAPLLCALVACGSSTDNPPAGAPSAPGSATPTSTPPPTGDPSNVVPPTGAAPPAQPTGTAAPPGATVLPKNQIQTGSFPEASEVFVAGDGRTLTLNVMARDSCSGVEAQVTEETAEAVKILLSPMLLPQGGPPDQVCAQVLTPRQVTVQLKEPLGNRRVFITQSY